MEQREEMDWGVEVCAGSVPGRALRWATVAKKCSN